MLGVPEDPWPPDHRRLLGISPDVVEIGTIEARAQDLSAALRSYQLTEPDAVTEALNLVAQALVELTGEAQAAAQQAPQPTPASSAKPESPQRWLYRRLALARRMRSAWMSLEPWFADPQARIGAGMDAVTVLRGLWTLRDCAENNLAPDLGPGGRDVLRVARHRRALTIFRRLSIHGRTRLASMWHAGRTALDAEIVALRASVRRGSPGRRRLRRWYFWWCDRGLDATLIALALLALSIALWRSR